MRCEERERLWEAYNQALDIFTDSVEELGRLGKPFTPETFGVCLTAVQAAKDNCKWRVRCGKITSASTSAMEVRRSYSARIRIE